MEQTNSQAVLNEKEIQGLIEKLARKIIGTHSRMEPVGLVGIRTGGAHLAGRLKQEIQRQCGAAPDSGVIDITLYRDDWTRLHSRPVVGRTSIDFSVEGRSLILVDDVLYTGRTTRAALDALIDLGRPNRIELCVLIDRGGRELPIQPDYVGARLEASPSQIVDVLLTEEGNARDAVVMRQIEQ